MGFVLVPFCASHKVSVGIQVLKNKNNISFFFQESIMILSFEVFQWAIVACCFFFSKQCSSPPSSTVIHSLPPIADIYISN